VSPGFPNTKLRLSLKTEHYRSIEDRSKKEEYRLRTPYWRMRIEGRTFSGIILTLGYPSTDQADRIMERPWRGYEVKTITHPHFGPDPVEVYAIKVNE
jgi:hypothetical protein